MEHRSRIEYLIFSTFFAFVVLFVTTAPQAAELQLVAVAPGYPGSTEQAQPSMDDFARGIERSAGWKQGAVQAVYYNDLADGLERLEATESAVALVPLPFYLEYRAQLGLRPLVEVVEAGTDAERWSLVAARGRVSGPDSLVGWRVLGSPGYSRDFVTDVVLADWGTLPPTTEVAFNKRVLSVLRKAAQGEPVAALLNQAQTESISELPFSQDLEVVTSSSETLASLVCIVGDRLDADRAAALSKALTGLTGIAGGTELLASIRMTRFQPVTAALLTAAEQAFDKAD